MLAKVNKHRIINIGSVAAVSRVPSRKKGSKDLDTYVEYIGGGGSTFEGEEAVQVWGLMSGACAIGPKEDVEARRVIAPQQGIIVPEGA